MTVQERQRLRLAMSRANERAQIREAIAAGAVKSSIDRLLGEELIGLVCEFRAAWDERATSEERMQRVIDRLDELVPRGEKA